MNTLYGIKTIVTVFLFLLPLDRLLGQEQSGVIDSLKVRIQETEPSERLPLYFDLMLEYAKFDNNQAKNYADTLLSYSREQADTVFTIRGLYHKGRSNYFLGNYQEALLNYQEGLDLAEAIDSLGLQAAILNDIGTLVKRQGDIENSQDYFERALSISRQADNKSQVANSLNNLGIVYDEKEDYDRAMDLYRESAEIKEEIGDTNGLTYNLVNMGMVTAKLGQYEQSEQYFNRAIKLREELGQRRTAGIAYNNLAEMLMQKGELDRAEEYFRKALEIAEETNYHDFRRHVYSMLSDVAAQQNNFEEALANLKLSEALEDSLYNANRSQQLLDLELKYQTEKREQRIELQQSQLQRKEAELQRNYLILGGLILLLILSAGIFYLYRSQLHKQQKLAVQEAQINASIASQEKERRRFAQDLHDGMGQLISACRLQLARLNPNQNAKAASVVDQSEKVLDKMHAEIRNIAFNLMPATLVQNGLIDALKELASRISSAGNLEVEVSALGMESRLAEEREILLYRIVQEWINNVLKYGNASKIHVQILGHDEEIILTIEDDGDGFDTETLSAGAGYGWKNINSRADMMDGEVYVESAPKAATTTFVLRIPKQEAK